MDEINQENKLEEKKEDIGQRPKQEEKQVKEDKLEQKEQKSEKKEGKEKKEQNQKTKLAKFFSSEQYNKSYKILLTFSLLFLAFSIASVFIFYAQHGDIMYKDVTLTGGTIITVYKSDINLEELESFLKIKLGEVSIRRLEDITTRKTIAFTIETTADAETTKLALEEYLGFELNSENSSTEISGATLAKSFYKQLLIALAIAFVFMAIVVLIIFRAVVPSLMVVLCAAADIICTLSIVNFLGFRVSTAGIAAFLMLVGYSVDTDTMLTTKVLKRRGEAELNSRIKSAFKTGITMTVTSIAAVLIGYFISQASVLREIFLILTIGLVMDIFFTWCCNASLLKLYCEKKKIS
ncbi:MAG: protein translocase subunit SecF [Candidatus Pacearchaeota archaeon]